MQSVVMYRSPSGLTKLLEIVLLLVVVVMLAALAWSCLRVTTITSSELTLERLEETAARERTAGGVLLVAQLLAYVMLGVWVHRAYANLEALGAAGLGLTPGWAVACFYIPIVSLWKPYEVMNDLWRASRQPDRWQSLPDGGRVLTWWVAWLAVGFLTVWETWVFVRLSSYEGLVRLLYLDVATRVSEVLLILLTIRLVSRIAEEQDATAERSRRPRTGEERRAVPANLRYDPPTRAGAGLR